MPGQQKVRFESLKAPLGPFIIVTEGESDSSRRRPSTQHRRALPESPRINLVDLGAGNSDGNSLLVRQQITMSRSKIAFAQNGMCWNSLCKKRGRHGNIESFKITLVQHKAPSGPLLLSVMMTPIRLVRYRTLNSQP